MALLVKSPLILTESSKLRYIPEVVDLSSNSTWFNSLSCEVVLLNFRYKKVVIVNLFLPGVLFRKLVVSENIYSPAIVRANFGYLRLSSHH